MSDPLNILIPLAMIVFAVWVIMDYNLSHSDKRESEDLARAIEDAYRKMEKDRENRK